MHEDGAMPSSDSKPPPKRSASGTGKERSPKQGGRPSAKSGDRRPPKDAGDRRPTRDAKEGHRPTGPRGPQIPDEITGAELDRRVTAELRTLPEGLATTVARLLVAVSVYIDEDPDLALAYAREAKHKAGRVAVVREALGRAAYAAGDFTEALSELRAVRRMTGSDDDLAILADCERGLGRPRKALELLASVPESALPAQTAIECRIVAAGARRDLGQPDAALLLLQVPALSQRRTEPWLARLRYAYADTLMDLGRSGEARTWFERAASVDEEGETDAVERLAELDGVTFDDDWAVEES